MSKKSLFDMILVDKNDLPNMLWFSIPKVVQDILLTYFGLSV